MKFNGIELKPGCLVRLKNERGNCWNWAGEMDRYIGRLVTISNIHQDDYDIFEIIQDSDDSENVWFFGIEDIQEVVSVPLTEDKTIGGEPNNFSPIACQFVASPEHTAKLKLGNMEVYITNKIFTKKQIKKWKKYFGVEVINLKSE